MVLVLIIFGRFGPWNKFWMLAKQVLNVSAFGKIGPWTFYTTNQTGPLLIYTPKPQIKPKNKPTQNLTLGPYPQPSYKPNSPLLLINGFDPLTLPKQPVLYTSFSHLCNSPHNSTPVLHHHPLYFPHSPLPLPF